MLASKLTTKTRRTRREPRRLLGGLCVLCTLVVNCLGQCPNLPGTAPFVVRGEPRFRTPVFKDVDIKKDIVYGRAVNDQGKMEALLLDVYQPSGDTALLRPAIIWVHGGGFRRLSKEQGFTVMVAAGRRFAFSEQSLRLTVSPTMV